MAETHWPSRLRAIALSLIVGCAFVMANFGGILRHVSESDTAQRVGVSGALKVASQMSKTVLGTSPSTLYQWLVICFWGLWLFLGAVLLLALSRWRPTIAGAAVGGLTVGLFSLAILSWLGFLVAAIVSVLGVIWSFLGRIAHIVGEFLAWLFALALPAIAVAAAIGAIILLWKHFGPVKLMVAVAGVVSLYLLGPALRAFLERVVLPFLRWLGAILESLFGWLAAVIKWLAVAVVWLVKAVVVIAGAALALGMIIGVLGSLGQIVIDQMKTAWEVGRSRKGILIGSFSLGSSLALILLVSVGAPESQAANPAVTAPRPIDRVAPKFPGKKKKSKKKAARTASVYVPPSPPPAISDTVDQAWHRAGWVLKDVPLTHVFVGTLPSGVGAWARRTFRSASAPIFDAVLLAVALGLSIIGTLSGVFSRKEIPLTVRFYRQDLVGLAALPILLIVAILAASEANQD